MKRNVLMLTLTGSNQAKGLYAFAYVRLYLMRLEIWTACAINRCIPGSLASEYRLWAPRRIT